MERQPEPLKPTFTHQDVQQDVQRIMCLSFFGHLWKPVVRYQWKLGRWYFHGEKCTRCDARRPADMLRYWWKYMERLRPWLPSS